MVRPVDLSVDLCGITLKNPVMTASGTFSSGREYSDFIDLSSLGAIVAKTVTLEPRLGNPPPRIWETPSGMLNAIGLQNPGADRFIEKDLPFLRSIGVPVILSLAGRTVDEYATLAKMLGSQKGVSALEVNISCPNIKAGGVEFGVRPESAAQVISAVVRATGLPVIAKLSPNVTSITEIGRAVVDGGASAISLINTLLGMSIDIERRRPRLSNTMGGLSGPAIRPVAVRMLWQLRGAVDVPLIGMGGIRNADDALEFILAGATAVAVGTANFADPTATVSVVEGLRRYCERHGVAELRQLSGAARKGDA